MKTAKLIALLLFLPLTTQAAAIATSHEYATRAAQEVIKAGGNAVDAAIAAGFMLSVVQQYKMGIGGGGLLLVKTGKQTFVWDHRETGPVSTHDKMFLGADGKPLKRYPDTVTGPVPVGIPGTPAGMFAAHKKLGRRPWKSLLAPAIKVAREGFPITQIYEMELEDHWDRLPAFPITATLYGDAEGG